MDRMVDFHRSSSPGKIRSLRSLVDEMCNPTEFRNSARHGRSITYDDARQALVWQQTHIFAHLLYLTHLTASKV
jgi:hypothetical protein